MRVLCVVVVVCARVVDRVCGRVFVWVLACVIVMLLYVRVCVLVLCVHCAREGACVSLCELCV